MGVEDRGNPRRGKADRVGSSPGQPVSLELQVSSGLHFLEASSLPYHSALTVIAVLPWARACPGSTCMFCSYPRTQAASCPAPKAAGFLESVGTGMETYAQGPGSGFGGRELAQGWVLPTMIPKRTRSSLTHHYISGLGALSRHLLSTCCVPIMGLGIPQWARWSGALFFLAQSPLQDGDSSQGTCSMTQEDFR